MTILALLKETFFDALVVDVVALFLGAKLGLRRWFGFRAGSGRLILDSGIHDHDHFNPLLF